MNNKETVLKIIEFYLFNKSQIIREVMYRKQILNTKSKITINKLYKPVNFNEMYSISLNIEKTVSEFNHEKLEFIDLRYKSKCTYEVIGGLMNKKRSTVFALGTEILDDILFNIMTDDDARNFVLNADTKSYLLENE